MQHLLEERERLLPLRERERLLRDRERLLPLRERERPPRGLGERPPSSALATSASFSSSCTADSIVMSTSQGCESASTQASLDSCSVGNWIDRGSRPSRLAGGRRMSGTL